MYSAVGPFKCARGIRKVGYVKHLVDHQAIVENVFPRVFHLQQNAVDSIYISKFSGEFNFGVYQYRGTASVV
jgi:hypothetical protein